MMIRHLSSECSISATALLPSSICYRLHNTFLWKGKEMIEISEFNQPRLVIDANLLLLSYTFICSMSRMVLEGRKNKQNVHGPHRSPEKQFQSINTFPQSYYFSMTLTKRENKFLLFENWLVLICKNLIPITQRYSVSSWNCPSGSEEKKPRTWIHFTQGSFVPNLI